MESATVLPGDSPILLNAWAADALRAEVGDSVDLVYFEVGAGDQLTEAARQFTLAGVLPMDSVVSDPHLIPSFPGIEGADDMSAWDPPFPVSLDRIEARDEAYWDDYRTAPKAVVPLATARTLWTSRFGDTTSVRVTSPGGEAAALWADRFTETLLERLAPGDRGVAVRALRREGLEGASGATDFAGLFFGLSLFLIASAVLLDSLLFRLALERRAREIGTLAAIGFPPRRIRRRFLAEGAVVAIAGCTLGTVLAVGYASLLLHGLRTWWLPAVGEPVLFLHLTPVSLAGGWLGAMVVVLLTLWWSARRLGGLVAARLLAGGATSVGSARPRRTRWISAVAGTIAVGAFLGGLRAEGGAAAGLAFATGAAALVAGLALFSLSLAGRSSSTSGLLRAPLLALGSRNGARHPSRTLLSVALVASAVFLLTVVAAYRGHGAIDPERRVGGTGGYTVWAESRAPFFSLPEAAIDAGLEGAPVVPFRLVPGDDVSCLNLFRPQRPRLLGVPPAFVDRGGFTFQSTIDDRDDPWTLLEPGDERDVIPAVGDVNSVLWILHQSLGGEIAMENEAGRPIRLRLVGLLERSVFQSELLIAEEALLEHFPSRQGYRVLLAAPPAAAARDAVETLERAMGDLGLDAETTAGRLAAFQAVEQTYLATFQTLGGFGLVLGTLGLGVVMLRNTLDRRREIAALAAFGFRRARLSKMIAVETATLLAAGLALGTAAGLLAAWPQLRHGGGDLPWLDLALLLTAVATVGMLASLASLAAVARLPLLDNLRSE